MSRQDTLVRLAFPREGIQLGAKTLFRNLVFEWHKGEHWLLCGPNGCGKSALLSILEGTLFAPEAELDVDMGIDDPAAAFATVSPERHAATMRSMDAYVQMRWNASEEEETPLLRKWLSRDAVEGRAPHECVIRDPDEDSRWRSRAAATMRELKVDHLLDRHIAALSNGEMRRAMLCRAILEGRPGLLLDSPFIGLDAESREILNNELSRIAAAGLCHIMLATTRGDEIPVWATHILELDAQGNVARQEPLKKRSAPKAKRPQLPKLENPSPTPESRAPAQWKSSGDSSGGKVLVQMNGLTVRYGTNTVFENFNWTVRQGERWLVTGPNGSGKTTLLSLVIGDHPQAYANDVRIFGRRRGCGESIWSVKRKIGWVSPELHSCMERTATALDVVLSGFRDTPLYLGGASSSQRKRALEVLREIGLGAKTGEPFGSLSNGEQRLVLLARALVKKPLLLVLDEPCQNLDTANRKRFLEIIDRVCDNKERTMLYVTHRADSVPGCIDHRLKAAQRH